MIIRKVGVGNATEAFIQDAFSDHLNIISSDDNNKGKTILIQSMMYSLGNIPAFPVSFCYDDYYHYIEFFENGKDYILCRKESTFILKVDSELMIFNGIAEFKRYWNKHISIIPTILKDSQKKLVDPELYLQLFFIGQDKKDTSNIINKGYYKKDDYINMLYSIMNIGTGLQAPPDIDSAKNSISKLKENRALLLKQHKVLSSSKNVSTFLSALCDRTAFEKKIHNIEELQKQITELKKNRNLIATRKLKCQDTLKELRSLNRTIDHGEVRCLDCNSLRVGFKTAKNATCSFDISTPELRESIILSINEKIETFVEESEKLTLTITELQDQIKILLEDEDITLEAIVAHKQKFIDATDAEKKIIDIDNDIKQLEQAMAQGEISSKEIRLAQENFINKIIAIMNDTYRTIDRDGNLLINGLFSEKGKVFSGSEATIFHLVKLYAIAKITQHHFPIVVDSFRAEDLSTMKENTVLDIFSEFPSQKIFTTTLKREEMGKYDNDTRVHHIDYTSHSPSKMLTTSYLQDFIGALRNIAIQI